VPPSALVYLIQVCLSWKVIETVSDQGESEATPYKQRALDRELGIILSPTIAVAQVHGLPWVVADMTAGSGTGRYGEGSPLILARRIEQLRNTLAVYHDYPVTFICVEHVKERLGQLQSTLAQRYPHWTNILFFRDQEEALSTIAANSVGLLYFDPTGYDSKTRKYHSLDEEMLSQLNGRLPKMDILLTRSGDAWRREYSAAHCKNVLSLPEYLTLIGKKYNYMLPYAEYRFWAFGFGSNSAIRAPRAMREWCDLAKTDALVFWERWSRNKIPLLPRGIERPGLWD
jgi:hypothetical protein